MITISHHFRGKHMTLRVLSFVMVLCIVWTLVPIAGMADETGVVTATELFLRADPSTEAEKLRTLQEGWKVTILGTSGDWYHVQYGEVIGYAASKYISKNKSSGSKSSSSASASSSSGKTVDSLGTAPKPCKPGDKNNNVLKIQQALTILGYYSGNQTGNYGDLTEQAVRDYQKAKGLSVDGIAGKGTIKSIFGVSPGKSTGSSSSGSSSGSGSKSSTERLDWFNGGKGVIPKDAVFQIKDVRSGRVFKARRWSGGNHLDAEPYTKGDTKKLKACYGGRFSWNRRPVLVKYNGHVYAGSMNGMPHGSDDTIHDNGFDGVFCIHFYQSKTHGSEKVDADHQACVKEAMNASW